MTEVAANAPTATRRQRILRWLKAEALPLLAMLVNGRVRPYAVMSTNTRSPGWRVGSIEPLGTW